ncbi:MAG: aromatic ring-hydroxylating dioxygenase subunit alpha [Betaproteobacteria bacterium]|nr:aromatic ring-hydroxylating dioxygenase subunit alpha [Betaproteobacteria bacterium]MBV9360627.1 aromatic ring-hydroxylating dioxygenase subunit alpha [Betaproteobacteria bacterium]
MLTREQNEFLTRTGPGTPMGNLFRRYWIPALLDWELPGPDCSPVRVKLLGEELIAFRDTEGRIGLIDEFCAHRGVSLWFGRNEECGLRCSYHGWKYDVNGNCVDLPSEPGERVRSRIKLKSYPTAELGGVIWAYMGPPEEKPALPNFEWVHLPASHRVITKRWQESYYLQAVEGGIDSSHVSFLHRGDLASDPFHKNTAGAKFAKSTKTTFEIIDAPGGMLIGARRDADPGNAYWRITQWIMPWYTLIPPYAGNALNGHAWVPMDDENCVAWSMTFHPTQPIPEEHVKLIKDGNGVHAELIAGTFRPVANRTNDYLIDRAKQKSGRHYSGVKGLAMQDASIQESQGIIADRTVEHLVTTDRAIVAARQRLLKAAEELQKGGKAPGLSPEAQLVRSASFVIPVDGEFEKHAVDAVKYRKGEPHVAV